MRVKARIFRDPIRYDAISCLARHHLRRPPPEQGAAQILEGLRTSR